MSPYTASLLTLGHRASDVSALLRAALDRFGRPSVVVADRWREAELRDALDKAGVPSAELDVRGMGFKDGAEDVRAFRRAMADGRVVPVPSLLLAFGDELKRARCPIRPVTAKLSKSDARRTAQARSRRCRCGCDLGRGGGCASAGSAYTPMALSGDGVVEISWLYPP